MNDLSAIDALEDRLAAAQVAHDVDTLDSLLDDALTFTGPTGEGGSKQDDLQAHRDRAYDLTRFDVISRAYDDVAPGARAALLLLQALDPAAEGLLVKAA